MAATLTSPIASARAFRPRRVTRACGWARAWPARRRGPAGGPGPGDAGPAGGASGHPRSGRRRHRPGDGRRAVRVRFPTAWRVTRSARPTSTASSGPASRCPCAAGTYSRRPTWPRPRAVSARSNTLRVAWDAPAGAASDINPGDSVVVFSTPPGRRRGQVVIPRPRGPRRPPAGLSPRAASFGAAGPWGRQWVLDLDSPGGAPGCGGAHERTRRQHCRQIEDVP